MDTVSMLNKMRFYCQPILPLVYDESMSYYETLCKVVGQLNTTGDTVNKLNEGLTAEIADRQAADAELDERLKVIEDTNKKIHFLVFDGANPNGSFPTRHELYQWVEAGDAIFTLLRTYEEGRGQIYAASCSYNAGNWGSEASNDFSIIVPLETTYDSTGKLAVKQKVAKLTIPPIPQTNLNAPWGLQIIEINTPSTSAEGIVNFSATVDNENTVHSNLSPAEFTSLYRTVSKGSGLIVGVNAQLTTNDSQLLLSTSADIIGGETASDDEVRIVFDAETSTGDRGLDLPYLNRLIYILSGSGTSETWTLTEFETYDFAFDRYEGFQFTRAANNAITPAFGSTPKDVAEYFGTVKGGTPYQNLPVRLIDTVNNAEYWNGVFDIKDDRHMTFTFVTSNYVTASGKMLVRVIELSADANTTTWEYAEKEFELPITGSFTVDDALSDTSTNPVQNKVVKAALDGKLSTLGGEISGNLDVGLTVVAGGSVSTGVTKSDSGIHFEKAASDAGRISHGMADADGTVPLARLKVASPTEDDDAATKQYVDSKASGTGAVRYDAAQTLTDPQKLQARKNIDALGHNSPQVQGYLTLTPANAPLGTGVGLSPSGSGNDFTLDISDVNEGTPTLLTGVKTPTDADTNAAATVEYVKTKVASGGSPDAVLYTPQTLTDAQKKQARENLDAASYFVVTATPDSSGSSGNGVTLDKTAPQIQEAISAGKTPVLRLVYDGLSGYMPLLTAAENTFSFGGVLSGGEYGVVLTWIQIANGKVLGRGQDLLATDQYGKLKQTTMAYPPVEDMQIATKKYVDDKAKKAVVIDVSEEEVKSYNYSDIDSEITNGGGNVWLSLGTNQMRMVAYDKSGASSYELTFVNLAANGFNIHTITVSPSAASYACVTK